MDRSSVPESETPLEGEKSIFDDANIRLLAGKVVAESSGVLSEKDLAAILAIVGIECGGTEEHLPNRKKGWFREDGVLKTRFVVKPMAREDNIRRYCGEHSNLPLHVNALICFVNNVVELIMKGRLHVETQKEFGKC